MLLHNHSKKQFKKYEYEQNGLNSGTTARNANIANSARATFATSTAAA